MSLTKTYVEVRQTGKRSVNHHLGHLKKARQGRAGQGVERGRIKRGEARTRTRLTRGLEKLSILGNAKYHLDRHSLYSKAR